MKRNVNIIQKVDALSRTPLCTTPLLTFDQQKINLKLQGNNRLGKINGV